MTDFESLPRERIVGRLVTNEKAENLGHIEDVVLDPQTGRIAYAIIEFGGIWGLGGKLYVVPSDRLRVSSPDAAIETFAVSGIELDTLDSMPYLDRTQLPDVRSADWRKQVDAHFERLRKENRWT
jgi:sporulation protein YlmC with PRC-barrel domain